MWKSFDADVIKDDLKILSQHSIKYLRVFPLWSDFQPAVPSYACHGEFREYHKPDGGLFENHHFLDEKMMAKVKSFCDIVSDLDMKLIPDGFCMKKDNHE